MFVEACPRGERRVEGQELFGELASFVGAAGAGEHLESSAPVAA